MIAPQLERWLFRRVLPPVIVRQNDEKQDSCRLSFRVIVKDLGSKRIWEH